MALRLSATLANSAVRGTLSLVAKSPAAKAVAPSSHLAHLPAERLRDDPSDEAATSATTTAVSPMRWYSESRAG